MRCAKPMDWSTIGLEIVLRIHVSVYANMYLYFGFGTKSILSLTHGIIPPNDHRPFCDKPLIIYVKPKLYFQGTYKPKM
jgi:hypothetical protein